MKRLYGPTLRRSVLPSLLLAGALAACTHGPALSTNERLAVYREHAGAAVGSFQLDQSSGKFEWTPLGDQALAIWPSAFGGYLLEFRTRCPAILTAPHVWITHDAGQVAAPLDSVMMRSASGTVTSACRIATIRPVDGRSLYEATREWRQADVIDRSQLPPEQATPLP
ncbi:DUF6491 family protein [Lysobacter sp. FW306-1B-D06B]|uniref:DUF6491 family protein n=1 Tax=Lysobacter sp. FW306-1B-D06B TaxID=3140250 RepID=UPI00314075CA